MHGLVVPLVLAAWFCFHRCAFDIGEFKHISTDYTTSRLAEDFKMNQMITKLFENKIPHAFVLFSLFGFFF